MVSPILSPRPGLPRRHNGRVKGLFSPPFGRADYYQKTELSARSIGTANRLAPDATCSSMSASRCSCCVVWGLTTASNPGQNAQSMSRTLVIAANAENPDRIRLHYLSRRGVRTEWHCRSAAWVSIPLEQRNDLRQECKNHAAEDGIE